MIKAAILCAAAVAVAWAFLLRGRERKAWPPDDCYPWGI